MPSDWLPPALESPEVSGRTAGGVPVAAGAGDQAAAALGVGVDRPGPVSVVLGTSGVVFAALPDYAADPRARVHVFCHAVPGTWEAMGVMLSAAGSLQWVADVLGAEPAVLAGEASGWEPGAEGLLFAPYLAGRAHAARRPQRPRCLRRALAPARPGSPGARCPRGRRLRAARLARAPPRARGRSPPSRARLAAARAASSGSRSSRRCSACRSSGPRSRRGRRSARRCSAASPPASSRRGGRRGLRPRARHRRAAEHVARLRGRLRTLPGLYPTLAGLRGQ